MKKVLLLSIALFCSGMVFAGGIMTNANQSAMYTRLMVRDATLGIDAVYYNPAGLNFLPNDGFHLSLNNQSITQNRLISSDNPLFTNVPTEYKGKVSAPLFPGIYAAYKTGKWAFSFGFNPVGGGGGAKYDDGLPSFESEVAVLPPLLNSQLAGVDQAFGTDFATVNGYRYNTSFEGTSIFFGEQLNVSYAINDMISVAIGGRFVHAKETYKGYLTDVEINSQSTVLGGWQDPAAYVSDIADFTRPLDSATGANLDIFAALVGASTADRLVDVEQTGIGFTPIIGVNIKLSDELNLALKYEHQTKLELETKVIDNKHGGLFEDGEKVRKDMSSLISVGAMYYPIENLMVTGGFHMYFDTMADYGVTSDDPNTGDEIRLENKDILDNSYELAIGSEYSITEKLGVSIGYLRVISGTTDKYNTDLSYTSSSNTFGGGFVFAFTPKVELNLGASYTKYEDVSRSMPFETNPAISVTETYKKDALILMPEINNQEYLSNIFIEKATLLKVAFLIRLFLR